MEIAILIISSLALVACVAMIALMYLNKKNAPVSAKDPETAKDIADLRAELRASIAALNETLPAKMESAIAEKTGKQLAETQKALGDASAATEKAMSAFRTEVLTQIVEKAGQQVQATQKAMAEEKQANQHAMEQFQAHMTEQLSAYIKTLGETLDARVKAIDEKVDKSLAEGFKGAADSMSSLQKELGSVHEAQKNIAELQGQIVSLKSILANNQEKGRYGEWQLEMIMQNTFGETKGTLYDLQYALDKDETGSKRPDAVVFLDGQEHHQILCIDSKFSLVGYEALFNPEIVLTDAEKEEAKKKFKVAIKARVDETAKYIVKGKTVQNSIMFIPNDGIFAFVQNEYPDVVDEARRKGVIMASPTILQPLMASFRVLQIDAARSKNLEKINTALNKLGQEFARFIERWKKVDERLGKVVADTQLFGTTVGKIQRQFEIVSTMEALPGEHASIAEIENDD